MPFNSALLFDNPLVILAVALAGGLGSVVRLFASKIEGKLPWGILLANFVASIVVGTVSGMSPADSSPTAVAILMAAIAILSTGFAGGLSTFSSYAAQTVEFIRSGRLSLALANTLANLLLPPFGVLLGLFLATALLK